VPAGVPVTAVLGELVALQRQAVTWAVAAGRDADVPVHLSRSVVKL